MCSPCRTPSFIPMAVPDSCWPLTASTFRRSYERWDLRDTPPRPPPGGAMKIALVAHWDWVLYHFRLPLAERLRSCGVEIYLVSPRGEYAAGLREAGFRWLEWKVERRGTNPVREMASVAQLTRLYRREGLQAVHHFTVKPVLYGSVAAGYAGVPTTINTFSGLGFLFSESEKARAWRVLIQPLLRRMLRRPSAWTIFP